MFLISTTLNNSSQNYHNRGNEEANRFGSSGGDADNLGSIGVADTTASIADTTIPSNEAVSGANDAGNPDSANATITIIMTTPPLPDE